MKTKPVCLAIEVAILCSPFGTVLSAQTSYGSIVGTVTDSTGATIPGASVQLTNLGTSERRTVESDSSGNYCGGT